MKGFGFDWLWGSQLWECSRKDHGTVKDQTRRVSQFGEQSSLQSCEL